MAITCIKLFINPTMHVKVMGRTRTGITVALAQNLSTGCVRALWPSIMVLVCDTPSCHVDHLWQINFISRYALCRGFAPPTLPIHTGQTLYTLPPFHGGSIIKGAVLLKALCGGIHVWYIYSYFNCLTCMLIDKYCFDFLPPALTLYKQSGRKIIK